jgi:hypothetical protein
MKLRLIWRQARDAPDGLDQVRHKLRQTIDAWSAADRTTVGSFLQQRIATEHASNPAAGWAEALTAALDYRRWHEFVIQRYQDGQWRPATGPASVGERTPVASVPLFAAASAYYKSAGNSPSTPCFRTSVPRGVWYQRPLTRSSFRSVLVCAPGGHGRFHPLGTFG